MDLISELKQIGFTEYEAKVYLALLNRYPATGYQLSKTSGVPRSMVYETLRRLHTRGAVMETVEERATYYRPLPPATLIESHETDHKQLILSLRSGLHDIYTSIEDDRVWTISGRSAILTYAGQLIQESTSGVFLVVPDDALEFLRPVIQEACQRGVDANTLLTGDGDLNCGRVARHPPLESELQELIGILLVAVDGVGVLIASPRSHQETKATVTRNPDLVHIARQFVWMELFTQRIYARLGSDVLDRLEPEDKAIFASLGG
ncbi:MAG TPA: helix-turn-helix domain-containing protein [candidate division Zixibacteria bacterium]|nr:helix-turn-helix domain-containing protein [candidate division Zixibacteria bacterium]